jgi:hypothetical protein
MGIAPRALGRLAGRHRIADLEHEQHVAARVDQVPGPIEGSLQALRADG